MTKRFFLFFICLLVLIGGVFAQSEERAKNNISLSAGIIGAELSYERMFNRHFSVLADVSYTTLIVMDEFTVSGKGRWYPFGKIFYLDLGLGFSYGEGVAGAVGDMILLLFTFGNHDVESDVFRSGGFLIQPGLGWKIDIGKPDGFVLPVAMGLDIKLGSEVSDFMPYLRAGLGYSF